MKLFVVAVVLVAAAVGCARADMAAVAKYADNHWNCADIACKSHVSAGSAQPNFQCAEFVARSLAAGGYIPGLGPNDAQSKYYSHKHDGKVREFSFGIFFELNFSPFLSDVRPLLGFVQAGTAAGTHGVS